MENLENLVTERRYTEAETASILGISQMSVRRRREDGSLGFYQISKRILIGESHISQFLRNSERNSAKNSED